MTVPRQPFHAFLDRHHRPVLGFLRAMVGPEDADDVFQETFLAALRAYPGMDGRHPRAWVMTIAKRKALDHHRARARRPEPRAELPERAADRESLDGAGGEIWRVVGELSPARRAAVALRFVADLRYSEIAAALGCSEDAARRRVHDGLAELREKIDPEVTV